MTQKSVQGIAWGSAWAGTAHISGIPPALSNCTQEAETPWDTNYQAASGKALSALLVM